MLASAREPRRDGGLTITEDPLGSGRVQPFGQARQHQCDLLRGGFQTIQRRVASSTEGGTGGLAGKGLDPVGMAVLANAKPGGGLGIWESTVHAPWGWTGKSP